MRVYIAASSQELDRVRDVARRLEEAGAEIDYQWWLHVAGLRALGLTDADMSRDEQREAAWDDLRAIKSADVLLFLAPTTPTRGAWVELGFALAQGVRVVVAGDTRSIFGALAEHRFYDDDEAMAFLAGEGEQ